MIYIGIDPGFSGALAKIFGETGDIVIYDAPTLVVGEKRQMDLRSMRELLRRDCPHPDRVRAFIEKVHSMPGSSGRSMFTFGRGYGEWVGTISAYEIPLTEVEPARWKRVMIDGHGKDKDASRYRAMQLFPQVADQLKRKQDDGRAEALLIAEFGRRTSA